MYRSVHFVLRWDFHPIKWLFPCCQKIMKAKRNIYIYISYKCTDTNSVWRESHFKWLQKKCLSFSTIYFCKKIKYVKSPLICSFISKNTKSRGFNFYSCSQHSIGLSGLTSALQLSVTLVTMTYPYSYSSQHWWQNKIASVATFCVFKWSLRTNSTNELTKAKTTLGPFKQLFTYLITVTYPPPIAICVLSPERNSWAEWGVSSPSVRPTQEYLTRDGDTWQIKLSPVPK